MVSGSRGAVLSRSTVGNSLSFEKNAVYFLVPGDWRSAAAAAVGSLSLSSAQYRPGLFLHADALPRGRFRDRDFGGFAVAQRRIPGVARRSWQRARRDIRRVVSRTRGPGGLGPRFYFY